MEKKISLGKCAQKAFRKIKKAAMMAAFLNVGNGSDDRSTAVFAAAVCVRQGGSAAGTANNAYFGGVGGSDRFTLRLAHGGEEFLDLVGLGLHLAIGDAAAAFDLVIVQVWPSPSPPSSRCFESGVDFRPVSNRWCRRAVFDRSPGVRWL